jgi:rhodanese-related sulfurtransferase
MRRLSAFTAIALTIVLAFAAHASAQSLRIILDDPQGPEKFKIIRADELANMVSDPASHVVVYDANFPETRERFGVIDGSHLLSSYDNFNVAKELPADKNVNLVFYCYDKRCMASHFAARRAIKAGYKNVSVMGDGIVGWAMMREPIHQVSAAEAQNAE